MRTEDEPVTRREVEMRWAAHGDLHGAHERAHDREHAMTAEALDKAVQSMDRRLEGMNEFRASLKDQAGTFVRMDTYQALLDRVIAIEKSDVKGEGKALGQAATVGAIIAAIGVAATVVSLVVLLAGS